jgi:ABC-type dipeptide/oligopeptide/nickel transport system permease component
MITFILSLLGILFVFIAGVCFGIYYAGWKYKKALKNMNVDLDEVIEEIRKL